MPLRPSIGPAAAAFPLRPRCCLFRLPVRTCMIMPEVMMGEMPSSIRVPREEARIMRMM
jgi:hypothetical protein